MCIVAVIRHWFTVMTPSEAGTGGLGLTIIDIVHTSMPKTSS